jgi:hypothetical protein
MRAFGEMRDATDRREEACVAVVAVLSLDGLFWGEVFTVTTRRMAADEREAGWVSVRG